MTPTQANMTQVSQNVCFQGNSGGFERAFPVLTTASVLSVKGKKVLHIDRNDHYGG